jgi:glycosyltransferase involved in cell wall biosynthesis
MMTGAILLSVISSLGLNIKLIGSERTHPPMYPLGQFFEVLRKYCYALTDAIVAVTSESADWLRINTHAKRVAVIANSVSLPLDSFDPGLPINSVCRTERKIVLAVGRFTEEKQLDLLVHAFQSIANNHLDWDLVIVGDGPLRKYLEDMVVFSNFKNRIFFPGKAGNIGEWYEHADLFVLCSKVEGFPNSLLEAMVYGVASISFDCDTGPRDIIENEVNGILLSCMTSSALASAMSNLMCNELLRNKFSNNALKLKKRYSFQNHVAQWENIIK